jgi:hypothetical protein
VCLWVGSGCFQGNSDYYTICHQRREVRLCVHVGFRELSGYVCLLVCSRSYQGNSDYYTISQQHKVVRLCVPVVWFREFSVVQ